MARAWLLVCFYLIQCFCFSFSVDHVTLLEGVIVLEEFCKELAAIAFVKFHASASSSPWACARFASLGQFWLDRVGSWHRNLIHPSDQSPTYEDPVGLYSSIREHAGWIRIRMRKKPTGQTCTGVMVKGVSRSTHDAYSCIFVLYISSLFLVIQIPFSLCPFCHFMLFLYLPFTLLLALHMNLLTSIYLYVFFLTHGVFHLGQKHIYLFLSKTDICSVRAKKYP